MQSDVSIKDFIATLKPITDFNNLKKGDRIFNRCSLSIDYIDTFDHIEYLDGEEIIFYKNYKGELWHGVIGNYWYCYERIL